MTWKVFELFWGWIVNVASTISRHRSLRSFPSLPHACNRPVFCAAVLSHVHCVCSPATWGRAGTKCSMAAEGMGLTKEEEEKEEITYRLMLLLLLLCLGKVCDIRVAGSHRCRLFRTLPIECCSPSPSPTHSHSHLEGAEELLGGRSDGTFLIRTSCTIPKQLVISVVENGVVCSLPPSLSSSASHPLLIGRRRRRWSTTL